MEMLRAYFRLQHPSESEDFVEALVVKTWFDSTSYLNTLTAILEKDMNLILS